MQQARDFLDESDALHTLVSDLSEDQLRTRTLFKGWTIAEIITHLHVWNWAADTALADPDKFRQFWKSAQAHLASGGRFSTFEKAWLGDMPTKKIVDLWRSFSEPMARRFENSDPRARVAWAGPDMSVRSSMTARQMETWAHGQAIYDLMGLCREEHDRIRNIVVLGVNTYGWTFANRGMRIPSAMPYLQIVSPSGQAWTFGDVSQDELISGSAVAFCQVVTQTRNAADVDLKITGDSADLWMSNAQCFAGPVETPPQPGERRRAMTSPFS